MSKTGARPRLIFAGTPEFSIPCLQILLEQAVDIVAVYTQPDRAAGRGKKLQPSPVKRAALEAGLDVFQPESFKSGAARATLAGLQADLMIVVAYGLILPSFVLKQPRLGCVNIHASLLPRWRGAAPIQRAIEAGDRQTGVCLMQMGKGLDNGPVLARRTLGIGLDDTGGQVHDALSRMAAQLLHDELNNLLAHVLTAVPQAAQGLCYAHKLDKAETGIDWQQNAIDIGNKIRAFNPWPVMSGTTKGQLIRIHQAHLIHCKETGSATPGEIIDVSAQGITVLTGQHALTITQLQKPGGRVLDAGDFLNGFRLTAGDRFA